MKIKLTFIIATILIISGCVNQVNNINNTTPATNQESYSISGLDCEKSIPIVKDLIDSLNYCDNKSDCGLLREQTYKNILPRCTFGCNNLVNKNADFSQITNIAKKYEDKECLDRICKCGDAPRSDEIECVNNKCSSIK